MEQYLKEYLVLAVCLGIGMVYALVVWFIQTKIMRLERKRMEEDPNYMPWD